MTLNTLEWYDMISKDAYLFMIESRLNILIWLFCVLSHDSGFRALKIGLLSQIKINPFLHTLLGGKSSFSYPKGNV